MRFIYPFSTPRFGNWSGFGSGLVAKVWLVVVINAFLLPIYGPLVDTHFVEHQPHHQHIYLHLGTARIYPAIIPYNRPQTHSHPELYGPGISEEEIISLPAFDPCDQSATGVTASPFQGHIGFVLPAEAEVRFIRMGKELLSWQTRFLRPPEPPPRAG